MHLHYKDQLLRPKVFGKILTVCGRSYMKHTKKCCERNAKFLSDISCGIRDERRV